MEQTSRLNFDNLHKRELFAVSLRKQKREQLIKKKRINFDQFFRNQNKQKETLIKLI